jgi:GT2 family glycosyltransferase
MPADPAPSVSVIVCAFAWERRERLVEALRSLSAQTHRPQEVIVVVDHAPELHRWIASEAPPARVIAGDGPPGLAGARNTGVAAARGEIVAFLDDDAVAAPDWLSRLLAPYEDPRVVGVGGAVLPRWPVRRPGWLPREFDWVVGCSYRGLPAAAAPVRNLIGCNMSFRRVSVLEAGGFAPGLGRVGRRPLGCEETDLCIRLRRHDRERIVLYDPAATVLHHVAPDRVTARYFLARCRAEGLSKRQVARRCGREDGLASERSYVLRTLPRGMASALRAAYRDGDLGALARAAAIPAGCAATLLGFVSRPVGSP